MKMARAFEDARAYSKARKQARPSGYGVEAQFFLARLELERLREDFKGAAKEFDGVCATRHSKAEEACYLAAKARGRMGDVVGAIDGYQTYRQKYPRGQFAKDAQFFSAFLLYENGRFKRARARFKEIGGGWRAAAPVCA